MKPQAHAPNLHAAHVNGGSPLLRSAGVFFDGPEGDLPGVTLPGQVRRSAPAQPAQPAPAATETRTAEYRAPDIVPAATRTAEEPATAADEVSRRGIEAQRDLGGLNEVLSRLADGQEQIVRALRGEDPMPKAAIDANGVRHENLTREDLQRQAERMDRERAELERQREIIERDLQRTAGLEGLDKEEAEGFSLIRAAAVARFGFDNPAIRASNWKETEILRAFQAKVARADSLGIGAPNLGGITLPTEVNASVGERLKPRVIAIRLGATVLPMGTTYDMLFPQHETSGTAHWVGSEKQATPSNLTLSSFRLTAKPLVATMPITDDGIFFTNGQLQQLAEMDLIDQHAEALDAAIFNGQGAAGEPLGIANTDDVISIDWGAITGTTVTETSVAKFAGAAQVLTKALKAHKYALQKANALRAGARTAYAGHPGLFEIFDEEGKDADGKPLFNDANMPANVDGTAQTLDSSGIGMFYGARAGASTLINFGEVASGTVSDFFYGDFSQIVVGQFGNIEMRVTDSHSDDFDYGRLRIRMKQRVDAVLRRGQYFTAATNLKLVA